MNNINIRQEMEFKYFESTDPIIHSITLIDKENWLRLPFRLGSTINNCQYSDRDLSEWLLTLQIGDGRYKVYNCINMGDCFERGLYLAKEIVKDNNLVKIKIYSHITNIIIYRNEELTSYLKKYSLESLFEKINEEYWNSLALVH